MKLTLHLVAGLPGAPETTAHVAGDMLRVDGVDYDLGAIPEGGCAQAQGSHPFAGPITRIDGVIHAALIWVYDGATALSDQGAAHPVIDIDSGPVANPVARKPEAAA